MLYNDLQDGILRKSYNKCKFARIWDEFEHGEVKEERAHNVEVTQDKAHFEDKLARDEAHFQLQQTQRQEEFRWAHLSRETDFKSGQLQEHHDPKASLVAKEARLWAEVAQRRLAQ